jgi:hypothetical protein
MNYLPGNTKVIVRWRIIGAFQFAGQIQRRIPGDRDEMIWKIASRLVDCGNVDFISTVENCEEIIDGSALDSSIE